ncbi:MAG: hypothetical protein R6U69_03590 [Marinobacter sp.]|uniref:hypothetical protein n=1 Tax=Marinobacter sp. TaxID=50741 RepID=UPI0039747C06
MKSENARPLWMLRFAITDLRSRISALKVFLACLILGVTLVAATASLPLVREFDTIVSGSDGEGFPS